MAQDRLLSAWVRFANAGLGNIPVTLWVGGSTVSGTLVSVDDYLDGIAAEAEQADLHELGEAYRSLAEQERVQGIEPFSFRLPPDTPDVTYVHVRESGGAGWWRARIDAVDGYAFGPPESE